MQAISGVNVAAVTPQGNSGPTEANLGAALELIDYLCQAGVKGIALLGCTGEFLHLDSGDRVRLTYMAVKRSRVPVMVGVGHSTFAGALALGREACSAGAAGLLLLPPYFFRYGQEEIREFYLQYAAQMGRNVPVYLYNIPFFSNPVMVETAVELLETGLFAGIKDSSGDFAYMTRLLELRSRQPMTVLVGNDVIFTQGRKAGADGGVSGVACAVPELMLGLDRAIQDGDEEKVKLLDSRLFEYIGWIDRLPTPMGIKAAVETRGVRLGSPVVPLSPGGRRVLAEFQEWFCGWLPVVKREAAEL